MEYIEFKDVSKTFHVNNQTVHALIDVNLFIKRGEIVAFMGRSGSGKSTIINIIAGLLRFEKGSFLIDGNDLSCLKNRKLLEYRRKHIGMIVQEYALLEDETVFDNISLPLKLRKYPKETIIKMVDESINSFGLKEKSNIPVCKLSGGQKQRVGIARAMCYNPEILLADEPTAALDYTSEQEIMDCFIELNNKGTTIILVTHDQRIAEQSHRIVNISEGRIVG